MDLEFFLMQKVSVFPGFNSEFNLFVRVEIIKQQKTFVSCVVCFVVTTINSIVYFRKQVFIVLIRLNAVN